MKEKPLVFFGPRLSENLQEKFSDLGLLILRLGFGGIMLLSHGWGKLISYGEQSENFPDPLGVGSSTSMILAIGAEFFCSFLLVVGLASRLVTVPLIATMVVAAFIVHADDPFQKKEMAVIYLLAFLSLFLCGPGKYSLDYRLSK